METRNRIKEHTVDLQFIELLPNKGCKLPSANKVGCKTSLLKVIFSHFPSNEEDISLVGVHYFQYSNPIICNIFQSHCPIVEVLDGLSIDKLIGMQSCVRG